MSVTWQLVLAQGALIPHNEGQARVLVVVRHHLDELRKMPRVPLAHAHDKGVDVAVQRVKQGDGLDDHIVHSVHVELHLRSTCRIGK